MSHSNTSPWDSVQRSLQNVCECGCQRGDAHPPGRPNNNRVLQHALTGGAEGPIHIQSGEEFSDTAMNQQQKILVDFAPDEN